MKVTISIAALLVVAAVAALASVDGERATAGENGFFLDSYKCYRAVSFGFDQQAVNLSDQFDSKEATAKRVQSFCDDVQSFGDEQTAGNEIAGREYVCYHITQVTPSDVSEVIEVDPQEVFDNETLLVTRAEQLCVRTEKKEEELTGNSAGGQIPQGLKCYKARRNTWEGLSFTHIDVEDQFGSSQVVALWPVSFCVPLTAPFLQQGAGDIGAAGVGQFDGISLVCYRIWDFSAAFEKISVNNALQSDDELLLLWADRLCIEAEKFEDD